MRAGADQDHAAITAPEAAPEGVFLTRTGSLTMDDGVRLAVTYFLPASGDEGEQVPVVLSMTPYRKDDDGFIYSYAVYPYLARRGIAVAHVDVRGTGASGGLAPDREYSDAELDDLEQVVAQLAALPWCNGSVGMIGISWSGFNSLMTAMRRPPALKAILVAHASEDLYGNDVHYIDGCLHVDMYSLEVEVENAVPRPPGYALDDAFYRERFDREPWLLAYLRHQRDGDWWQKGRSLRSDWSALDVPVYAIGSLLDGYRDFVPAILDHVDAPVWAEIGPWNHAWPHDGEPLPDYEWRRGAVRWFKRWLTDDRSVDFEGKHLTVFRRGAVPPDPDLTTTPGAFSLHDWPIGGTTTRRLVPQADHSLSCAAGGVAAVNGTAATHRLRYVAGSGVAVGNWWGEPTGDLRPADEHALTYDSPVLDDRLLVLGSPVARLTAGADAPAADWFVRLEDVWPDGRVSLVTGGGLNGTQRASRREPQALPAGELVALCFPLRFTTYTFEPGHRIRLVVTNAQFPMIWPSAQAMTTTLRVGDGSTSLDLPTVPPADAVTMPAPIVPDPPAPGARYLDSQPLTPFHVLHHDPRGITAVEEREGSSQRIGSAEIEYLNVVRRWVDNRDPARAGLVGRGREVIRLPSRTLTVRAVLRITSDAAHFHVTVRRSVQEDGAAMRTRTWSEAIPRDFQ